jgi:hypothetical protein
METAVPNAPPAFDVALGKSVEAIGALQLMQGARTNEIGQVLIGGRGAGMTPTIRRPHAVADPATAVNTPGLGVAPVRSPGASAGLF